MMKWMAAAGVLLATVGFGFLTVFAAGDSASGKGFELKDTPGDHLDVLLDGKAVARYMDAHDTSTKERHAETFKPYLHVFDADGKAPITKGPGGLYTHHRGIFIGWQKIGFAGKTYNLWEMASGDIVHKQFTHEKAGPDEATFTSQTDWNLADGKTILTEDRTMTFRRGTGPFRLVIDFTSNLKAPEGDVNLNGDPEHGGVQFRPANEIDPKQTVYVLPKEQADPHKDRDYPWAGETFTLNGQKHSVVEINHPQNPTGTRWSTYRDYGRFGAFPAAQLKAGESRTFRYEFLIADGEMPPAEQIQKAADAFTGASSPTPAPKVTMRPAEGSVPAKPAATPTQK